ncbi:hypothetical protein C7M84_019128 [Penaeus vannamei]|uniref:Uncharacterized protein n=1 Tax=Penaeus vannamei TaxID=6689 RepID=A0A423SFK8_PENVA|nr:hypothetical protein C7M84_019128 [Penaeus vannamei]
MDQAHRRITWSVVYACPSCCSPGRVPLSLLASRSSGRASLLAFPGAHVPLSLLAFPGAHPGRVPLSLLAFPGAHPGRVPLSLLAFPGLIPRARSIIPACVPRGSSRARSIISACVPGGSSRGAFHYLCLRSRGLIPGAFHYRRGRHAFEYPGAIGLSFEEIESRGGRHPCILGRVVSVLHVALIYTRWHMPICTVPTYTLHGGTVPIYTRHGGTVPIYTRPCTVPISVLHTRSTAAQCGNHAATCLYTHGTVPTYTLHGGTVPIYTRHGGTVAYIHAGALRHAAQCLYTRARRHSAIHAARWHSPTYYIRGTAAQCLHTRGTAAQCLHTRGTAAQCLYTRGTGRRRIPAPSEPGHPLSSLIHDYVLPWHGGRRSISRVQV